MKPKRIYLIVDPTTTYPIYVGATSNPLWHRIGQHRSSKKLSRIGSWCRDMKSKGYHVQAMELEAPSDGWGESEKFWIDYLLSIGAELLNDTSGGTENTMRRRLLSSFRELWQDETKRKRQGEIAKERWANPEYKAKTAKSMSEARKGDVGKRHSEFMKDLYNREPERRVEVSKRTKIMNEQRRIQKINVRKA